MSTSYKMLRVVMGPMFAGKTSYIVSHVKRNQSMGLGGLIIKPDVSSRQDSETQNVVTTHDEISVPCISWPMNEPLMHCLKSVATDEIKYIIVEEAQFCTGLVNFASQVVDTLRKELILVGLNGTYQRKPFVDAHSGNPEFLECCALADDIVLLKSLCAQCRDGTLGIFTHRIIPNEDIVCVGASNEQESLCRPCYLKKSTK